MKGGPSLPRAVVWLIRGFVPASAVPEVMADLADEYEQTRRTRAAFSARVWLARETASLLAAYLAAPLVRFKESAPMWLRDVRLVSRGLRRQPVATLAAAAMLSSGLLAVCVVGALTGTLLFRPVSELHGDALRRIVVVDRQGRTSMRLSFPELQRVREHLAGDAIVSAVSLQPAVVRANGADRQTMAEVVDGAYFGTTGVTAIVGRTLMAGDDRADVPRVAVISEPFWRNGFGASPEALGANIALNGASYTVVGVANAHGSSSFLGASVDVWVPLAQADPLLKQEWRTDLANRGFVTYALPALNMAEFTGRLDTVTADLADTYPGSWRERRLQTAPGTVLAGGQRAAVGMLAAILGGLAILILAVAAANISGLLLARAAADRRQAAIHLSLGSGRGAVARRLLLEGAALGLIAGGLAIAMYLWTRTWFAEIALLPTLALRLSLPFDVRIVALVVAAGLGTGLLLAVGPALWAARLDVLAALRDGGSRATGGRALAGVRRVLVSAQVCLSLSLVVGSVLFTRSLGALDRVDVGFPRAGLVAMDFDQQPAGLPARELPALVREALMRVRALPGITGAALSSRAPIDQSTPTIEVRAATSGARTAGEVGIYLVTDGYFETVGLPLVDGRGFTTSESQSSAPVVIVNETLAELLWPRGDAIDRSVYVDGEAEAVRVLGVARNSKYRALSEPLRPHIYRPTPPTLDLALLARTSGDPYDALRSIQRALDGVGPGFVGFFPRTLDDHVEIELLPTRTAATAATGLGMLAILLSAVGLYGLVAWFVELRRHEIGVRMALGATPRNVRTLVLQQAVGTAMPGMVAGLVLAIVLGVVSRAALFGVQPTDLIALTVGVTAVALIVMAASYVPGRRATRVDPAAALRQ